MTRSCFLWVALLAMLIWCPTTSSAQQSGGGALSSFIPPSQVFSCGTGTLSLTIGVTDHGNVLRFESPGGVANEHIHVGVASSGYQVCWAEVDGVGTPIGPFATAWDFAQGGGEGGWGATSAPSQPNGPGTFPLEITRNVAGNALTITRRFTGNSFVGPVDPGNPTYDGDNANGVGCDTLRECGNCANRTLHVLTRITNNTGTAKFVRVVEAVDFDISNHAFNDRFLRTVDSVEAWEDVSATDTARKSGMLLQSLIAAATTAVRQFTSFPPAGSPPSYILSAPPPTDCDILPSEITPTAPGDYEALLRQQVIVAPFSTDAGSFRLHYRRF